MTRHNHTTRYIKPWPTDCPACRGYHRANPSRRVLVTGSRDWDDSLTIRLALAEAFRELGPFRLVHGAARGADTLAASIQQSALLPTEPHPADWSQHGKRAGYLRNAEMVDAGADLCLAFIKNESRGATMCADLAESAGIPTRRFVPSVTGQEGDGGAS